MLKHSQEILNSKTQATPPLSFSVLFLSLPRKDYKHQKACQQRCILEFHFVHVKNEKFIQEIEQILAWHYNCYINRWNPLTDHPNSIRTWKTTCLSSMRTPVHMDEQIPQEYSCLTFMATWSIAWLSATIAWKTPTTEHVTIAISNLNLW